ncbi:MAG: Lrp/AsnC family transcriptional regulator [Beijerinckiaceae bacterium]
MHEKVSLDPADLRLLAALQANAAATNAMLAESVGLSASQVSRRRQALEEAGIITAYRAMLDPARIGLRLTAFIQVSLRRHSDGNARRFLDLVRLNPAILEAHAVTGAADYLVKVAVADLAELNALVKDLLAQESIERVRTDVVLETIKSGTALPLPRP